MFAWNFEERTSYQNLSNGGSPSPNGVKTRRKKLIYYK